MHAPLDGLGGAGDIVLQKDPSATTEESNATLDGTKKVDGH